ncbi:peptidoglycan-binding domain-containing protein [Streptomyces griseocarneus]|uniref:peptidoglycan-binding domain-containing protein n=1 Tax=Streptomyces griseocarneus TaxID=51201 RepID=UPI00167CBA6F|nr:peptidoglycan-binding domain-containing protein [Streptomyces griseocarneus]MBZ6477969.1 peptidoglycan-binding protein [Streptomyces griseocarneus]GHG54557.1 hypothetical protein GCM10018779_17620 [Streptomyces griseocarneus]
MTRLRRMTTALALGSVLTLGGLTATATASATDSASLPGPYGCNHTNAEPTISRGSSGAAVKQAQCLLKHWNVPIGSTGVDGKFGPSTEKGVKEFQGRLHDICGLAVDGIVGPKTWHALKHDIC